ncbi:MAG: HNH endonuclease [Kiritimatiellae bacterium]|nr:HNH endonuclease [Kiritimatiellia bacterium]MDD5523446.1 HNH endonuclease [Kiritimatiellia bacterium]
MKKSRPRIPLATQVRVLFRDGWLCRYCHGPVVFSYSLKYLQDFVARKGFPRPLAYYHERYRRDASPLCDHLAAVIDHVEAHSRGGSSLEDNLVTACNKCNLKKSTKEASSLAEHRKPKGKYGEPKHWDGMSSLFLVLARERGTQMTLAERAWLHELESYLDTHKTGL